MVVVAANGAASSLLSASINIKSTLFAQSILAVVRRRTLASTLISSLCTDVHNLVHSAIWLTANVAASSTAELQCSASWLQLGAAASWLGDCLARRLSGPGRCTKERCCCTQVHCNAFSPSVHCNALHRDNPTHHTGEGAPAKCSKVLWGSIMSGGDLGDLPLLLLLLLQLSLTLRMVAEKWPHKKAIKEHKGSEFRAQCEISRKWDICVHGARPAFDMFTRVQ